MDMKEKIKGLEEEIAFQEIADEILILKNKKILGYELVETIDDYDVIYAFADPGNDYKAYRLLKKKDEKIYAIISLLELHNKQYRMFIADYTNKDDIKRLVELSKLKKDDIERTKIEDMLLAFGVIIITLTVIASVLAIFSDVLIGLAILLGGVPIGLILLALSKILVILQQKDNE